MMHNVAGKRMGRNTAHRAALRKNFAVAVIRHERVVTTLSKAKALRPFVEKMITLARSNDPATRLHRIRQAVSALQDKDMVKKLFDVIGPRYVAIDVAAEVTPLRIEEAKAVEKRVFDKLRAFLHPLSGGPDGAGWEFGRAMYLSEVGAVVQGTVGVDRVRNLSIRKSGSDQSQESIAMGSNDLAASGHHTIVATGA